jgi:hypothetical protein
MKGVKKYYLLPEDRYKSLLKREDESPALSTKESAPSKEPIVHESPTESSQHSDPIEILDSGEQGLPVQSGGNDGVTSPGKKIILPPPGIPVKTKRKRVLNWISL